MSKVTVIIPAYNRVNKIVKFIKSVLDRIWNRDMTEVVIYRRGKDEVTIPRHTEINESLAGHIIRKWYL